MAATPDLPLRVELVPGSCWYRNVRANVSPSTWARLQQMTFMPAKSRCQICAGVGASHPVECHEVWHYDDRLRVQTLRQLIALCPRCHRVKHLGLALALGQQDRIEESLAWFCSVNQVSPGVALAHIQAVFAEHAGRSSFRYQLDVGLLRQYGIDLDSRGIERGHAPTAIDD